MRRSKRLASVGAIAVSLAAAATAVAASPPTGNARAVALARASVKAYTRIPALTYTQKGYIELTDRRGRYSSFYFRWGQTKLSQGYSWAGEHATVALSDNHVVWWRDDLSPGRCSGTSVCSNEPVEIVVEHRGSFWAFGNARHHTCFGRMSGGMPVTVGVKWAVATGNYSAPAYGRGTVKLTYTYPWGKTSATETDTLSKKSHLVQSGRTVIAGGHTIRASMRYPSRAPRAPRVHICAG